jgi:hypothetical protein
MRLVALLVLALSSACALPQPYGEGVAVYTLLSAGGRTLAHDDEDDLEGGAAYALELASLEASSGWGYEAGWTVAQEDAGGPRELEAEFDELHLGLRRTFVSRESSARPYFGFGALFSRLEREYGLPDVDVTDDGAGAYLRAGVLWAVGHFQLERGNDLLLGLDLRALVGDDYDALQLVLVLGAGG